MIDVIKNGVSFVAFNVTSSGGKSHLYVGQPQDVRHTEIVNPLLVAVQGGWGLERHGWHDANTPRTDYATWQEALQAHGFTVEHGE